MKAELILDKGDNHEIFVNSRKIKDNECPVILNAGLSKIEIKH